MPSEIPFAFDSFTEGQVTTASLTRAEDLTIKYLAHMYDDYSKATWARIQVFAAEKVGQFLKDDPNHWMAIRKAMIATLEEFPFSDEDVKWPMIKG